ncbi:MAG: DUF3417 domain-containing protein [Methanoculleus sp.]
MEDTIYDQFTHVPERISGLVDLAYNLWWSWNPEARDLFKQVNREAWKEYIHNPVRMLRETPVGFLKRASENPAYLRRYDVVMRRLRKYMSATGTWFSSKCPGQRLTHDRLLLSRVRASPLTSHLCWWAWVPRW